MVPVLGVVTGADTLEIQDSSPWLPGTGWRRMLPGVWLGKERCFKVKGKQKPPGVFCCSKCFKMMFSFHVSVITYTWVVFNASH